MMVRLISIAAFAIAAQAADLMSSLRGFEHGAIETNPLIHGTHDLIVAKLDACALLLAALVFAWWFARLRPDTRVWVVVAMIVVCGSILTTGVALHNLSL